VTVVKAIPFSDDERPKITVISCAIRGLRDQSDRGKPVDNLLIDRWSPLSVSPVPNLARKRGQWDDGG
jgi:hypothetical protein